MSAEGAASYQLSESNRTLRAKAAEDCRSPKPRGLRGRRRRARQRFGLRLSSAALSHTVLADSPMILKRGFPKTRRGEWRSERAIHPSGLLSSHFPRVSKGSLQAKNGDVGSTEYTERTRKTANPKSSHSRCGRPRAQPSSFPWLPCIPWTQSRVPAQRFFPLPLPVLLGSREIGMRTSGRSFSVKVRSTPMSVSLLSEPLLSRMSRPSEAVQLDRSRCSS